MRRVWLVDRPRLTANARVLIMPVTHAPAVVPKETGGSPEFPDYPSERMPRSDPGGVPPACLVADRTAAFRTLDPVGFPSGCPDLSFVHHYTFFGAQFRGLRPRLPSASHTVSRRSHFGSATDPVASLWSGGIDRLMPTHPLGNIDEFQGVSPLFHRPWLLSARPVISLASIIVLRSCLVVAGQ